MKLKKIASLMLAGIMAVSMLAACGDEAPGPNPGEGEGEGTQTSGYSSVFGEAVSDTVKDMEYVTFQDNAADQAALNKSVNFLSGPSIQDVANNQRIAELVDVNNTDGKTWPEDWMKMAKTLQSELKMNNKNMSDWDMAFKWFTNTNYNMVNQDAKCAVLYAVNGAVGTDEAVQTVAELLDEQLDQLDDEAEAKGTTWHYEYVVSVSVAEKSYNDSTAKFVMVTVDRTVTNMAHA